MFVKVSTPLKDYIELINNLGETPGYFYYIINVATASGYQIYLVFIGGFDIGSYSDK